MQTSSPHSDVVGVHTEATGTVNQEAKKSDATEEIRKSGLELKRVWYRAVNYNKLRQVFWCNYLNVGLVTLIH